MSVSKQVERLLVAGPRITETRVVILDTAERIEHVRKSGLVWRLSRVAGAKSPYDHALCWMCKLILDVEPDSGTVRRPPAELPALLNVCVAGDAVCAKCKPTLI